MITVDISTLRTYCRCEEDDDELLMELADAAEAELEGQGISLTTGNLPMLRRTVCAMVLHWHDNPAGGELSPALDSSINTLRQSQVKGVI